MVRSHVRRLERVFAAVLLSASPAAALAAGCTGGTSNGSEPTPADATLEPDDATLSDAPAEASAEPLDAPNADVSDAIAASDASCAAVITVITADAGAAGDAGRAADAGDAGDADLGCAIDLPCGLPPRIVAIGCELFHQPPGDAAPTSIGCRLVEDAGCMHDAAAFADGGFVSTRCIDCPGGAGRGTEGVSRPHAVRVTRGAVDAAYFAVMAHGEAASVLAFRRLACELAAHRAPRALTLAATRASRDEIRHARAMAREARARGAAPLAMRTRASTTSATPLRSLGALAEENAREGCVRETFGALLLAHQARAAESEELRATFAAMAKDELRHAALAWAIGAYAVEALDAETSALVRRATANEARSLRDELARRPLDAAGVRARAAVGLPGRQEALALFDAMCKHLALAPRKLPLDRKNKGNRRNPVSQRRRLGRPDRPR